MSFKQSLVLIAFGFVMCCYAHEQFYCGRSLARAIAAMCYQDNFDKRSEGTMYNAILSPYYRDQEHQYGWAWPPQKARTPSLPSRGKRPVVNECCDKPCTLTELLSYCEE